MDKEQNFERVGSARLSKMGKALNIHIPSQDLYLSIPITDIKAILFEQMTTGIETKEPTIASVRLYRHENNESNKQEMKKHGKNTASKN